MRQSLDEAPCAREGTTTHGQRGRVFGQVQRGLSDLSDLFCSFGHWFVIRQVLKMEKWLKDERETLQGYMVQVVLNTLAMNVAAWL